MTLHHKSVMYGFCDLLILSCLFVSGFNYGYYCKYSDIYDNLWNHWYAVCGCLTLLIVGIGLCLRHYKKRQFLFENFYLIFYGLISNVICSCFMLVDDTNTAFYFGFMAMAVIYLSCFSYIYLRCDPQGFRPFCLALGNTSNFFGFTIGFALYNEFEAKLCGWLLLGFNILMILLLIINEFLHYYNYQNYKISFDLVYNLLNDEKLLYASNRSVKALFIGRDDYVFKRNTQYLVVAIAFIILLEKSSLYSYTFLQLTWSATYAYLHSQYLYLSFLCYTIGCLLGCVLMLRYKPKLIYLQFAVIKIMVTSAILLIYNDYFLEKCFLFLCLYYLSMGVYSSVGLQMLIESCPFLYTELAIAISYSLEIVAMEVYKYETLIDDFYIILLSMGLSTICLTLISIILILIFLPNSKGLIEMRNNLLGIYRQPVKHYTNTLHSNNYFLQLEVPATSKVFIDNNRIFHQYPPDEKDKQITKY
uniref:Major facilitator superfamily associated domain-containing protein n=1 Tax=Glossina brevipalpis TaxID=37001 RepID=A0A1A9W1W3_9MUSC